MRLYSAFPFPNRKGRKLDDFGSEAWDYFQTNPDGKFMRTQILDGRNVVRVAIADKMVAQGCVNCHHRHRHVYHHIQRSDARRFLGLWWFLPARLWLGGMIPLQEVIWASNIG